jgi:glycosyltransferase involved in cell wall biosynthesis
VRVLVLVQSDVLHDARVLREATALVADGHEVTVVGRGVPAGGTPPAGVTVLDAGRPGGLGSASSAMQAAAGRPASPRAAVLAARRAAVRGARWALLPEHRRRVEARWRGAAAALVRDLPADVVHAHDRNTLALAASEAERRSVPFVYDAHELWSGRQLPGRPTPLADDRATARETALARSAAAVLTVSEGIAEVLADRGLPGVRVVRNTFEMAGAPDDAPPPSDLHALVYAGRIGAGRDLETLVRVPVLLPGRRVQLVGPADPSFRLPADLPDGVEVQPSREVDEVDEVYRSGGAAAVTLAAGSANHELALPNKLFHAVRAGVPVVAADLPEIRRTVMAHGFGELYRPGDATSLAAATLRVARRLPELTVASRAARAELSWEHDAAVLVEVYRGIGT